MRNDAGKRMPNALVIIPVRGSDAQRNGSPITLLEKPLLAYTIEAALNSPVVFRTIVTTDNPDIRKLAIDLGAEAPFLRPVELAEPEISLDHVLQHCFLWLAEHEKYHPDVVMPLEISHPLRPSGLLEQVVGVLIDENLDTVFTVYEERHSFWKIGDYGELQRVGNEEGQPRGTRPPLFREMAGLAMACQPNQISQGQRFGDKIGVVPLREPYALVDTQDSLGLALAKHLLDTDWNT
jgi:CMP-N-acetylneuraminic acid synthetase